MMMFGAMSDRHLILTALTWIGKEYRATQDLTSDFSTDPTVLTNPSSSL
jgi:hypothetical protein